MEMKLEVVPMPVSDVEAAKAFYTEQVGFHLDHDARPRDGMRVVQMTPLGDEQAIRMLAGTQDSAEFVKEYCELRRSGTPIEQALVLVSHEFRLRQPEVQLLLR